MGLHSVRLMIYTVYLQCVTAPIKTIAMIPMIPVVVLDQAFLQIH